ncbi:MULTISPECIES: GNAT family N-acetyltransferase [unclassified Bacillus (in: firmicutes)]|uniref:GNAT family N-acetyltransferase n=1 Tax=unclassified Bacillus (in: firmicutes) TaxID=185979 RepID=UPI0008E5C6A4|nr:MULTISPECIES: GNAT family N-acetyltransferase [unclassified Bacillus (in: firmicutes)]SFA85351.1 ribosomal-protein-alanine N-acetyltransferase [Bacillus sp. UNCCL13]SFQ83378.1 ribosomal-protein-alanine N-acetyltransferase [Bacillus sp. cl95]
MIESIRCKFLNVQNNDFEDVKKLYMNPRVREFLGGTVTEKVFLDGFKDMLENKSRMYHWCVRLKETNAFIGLVSLNEHHDGDRMEISYQILPDYWGQGLATELVKRLIRYTGEELKWRELIAETQAANRASCQVLLNAGMKFEQSLNRFGAIQNIYHIHTTTHHE